MLQITTGTIFNLHIQNFFTDYRNKNVELEMVCYNQNGDGNWSRNFPDLDSEKTIIFVFAAPEFHEESTPIKELSKFYPKSKMIGCSSAGEISGQYVFDKSISVAIVKFDKTKIKIVRHKISNDTESASVGKNIAEDLDGIGLRGIFVLSDGLNVNGSELVKGLNLGANNVILTGGLAGDGKNFKKTWVIFNGEILTNHVVAIGLYGENIQIGHASRGGWVAFGPERFVTRSKNNILYELDDQPALALYKDYLGEKASGLPATGLLYPLSIRKDNQSTDQLVRTILAIDEVEQSLTFAGDIPVGYVVRLMRSNSDRLITSASEAGSVAVKMIHNKSDLIQNNPILVIAVSCVGRRLFLGERTDEETESMLKYFPSGTIQVGFYSYGELSPFATGSCSLHNQAMTVTMFYEH